MKTKSRKSNSGTQSRTEQLGTEQKQHSEQSADAPAKQSKTVDFKQREENRLLPTERVLELLKTSLPQEWEIAEVVGKWIWIQFPDVPAEQIRHDLSQLGFHWNGKRQAWQHPCGQFTSGTPKEPREKYASYYPADNQRAA